MNCTEIHDKLTAYLLGDLDAAQAEDVRRHLMECQDCQNAARDLEAALNLLRKGLADTAASFPLKLSAERHQAVFAGSEHGARKNQIRRGFGWSLLRIAAVIGIIAVSASLFLPNLGSVRESARRVNDLSNLNGIYKAAAAWGLDPRDSFRPAFPPSLDQLVKDKTISPGIMVNPETGKPVEYYPASDDTDGNRVLLMSRGKRGRNIVKVSGSGMWVEDGTPEAAKLDHQLAGLKKQEFYESHAYSGEPAESPSSYRAGIDAISEKGRVGGVMAGRIGGGVNAVESSEKSYSEAKEPTLPEAKMLTRGPHETLGDYWAVGRQTSTKKVSASTPSPPAAAAARHVALPAAQQTRQEVSVSVQSMSSRKAAKTAAKRITTAAPSSFVRVETPVAAPQLQMEAKEDTKMTKSITAADIKRLQAIREFQKGWNVSMGDASAGGGGRGSGGSGTGGGGSGGRGGGAVGETVPTVLAAPTAPPPAPTNAPADDAAPAKVVPRRALGVNQFVNVAENQFSTFGIDVDTASYALARNYINRGGLPPAEEVRTEEFVNYFDYAYQPPRDKTFAVYSEIGSTPFGRGLSVLKIGVQARRLGREEKRPLALTLLVDTSGSMATPDRIELLKSALRRMIERLDPNDLVAVVQFDSQSRLLLAHTPAAEKSKILAVIDALQTSGSTNLEEGMKLAYAIAARAADSRYLSRVILLSDGVANLGTVAAEEILGAVEKYRKQGVYCSVFGFGAGAYNDAMLQTLADKGDGAYAFIDSDEEAERVLVDDLAAKMNVVARDAKIQVEFNPRRVIRFRQLGYEKRQLKKEQFRDDTVDAGEVGSGQCATALYELELNRNFSEPVGTVRVRYRNAQTGVIEEMEQPMVAPAQPAAFEAMDAHFRLAVGLAEFAEILRGSPYAAGRRLADVAQALRPVALELKVDRRIGELVRLTECGLMPKFTE